MGGCIGPWLGAEMDASCSSRCSTILRNSTAAADKDSSPRLSTASSVAKPCGGTAARRDLVNLDTFCTQLLVEGAAPELLEDADPLGGSCPPVSSPEVTARRVAKLSIKDRRATCSIVLPTILV